MWIGIVLMPIRLRIWIGIKVEIRIRKPNFYRSPSSHYLIFRCPDHQWVQDMDFLSFVRCFRSGSDQDSTGPVDRDLCRQK
jgi:hypothetical protein